MDPKSIRVILQKTQAVILMSVITRAVNAVSIISFMKLGLIGWITLCVCNKVTGDDPKFLFLQKNIYFYNFEVV